MPLVRPFTTSLGVDRNVEHVIIRLDAEGLTGWGECVAEAGPFYSGETVATAWHILQDFLTPLLLGASLSGIEQACGLMARVRGNRMAKAGLEAALWDIFAQAQDRSLASILGARRKKIDAGITIGIQASVDDLLRAAETYLAQGYRRVKIKIRPGNDIESVQALRREFPKLGLHVDANGAYRLTDIDMFELLEDCGLRLVEQPLHHEDLCDHAALQREISTPVGLDESVCSLGDARAACALGSCRAINIKPGRVGGILEAVRIHDMCAAKQIPVWHGGMLETGIGRAGAVALAALPNFTLPADISAGRRYYRHDIIEPAFELNPDGTLDVPDGPGIGVRVLTRRLERFTVCKKQYT